MSIILVSLFWITAFAASILGNLLGFGISTILLPIATIVFDFHTALALVSMFHLSGNIGRITQFREGI